MILTTFIRGIVKRHPELKTKIGKALIKQSPFQYIYQVLSMTIMSTIALAAIIFLVTKHDLFLLMIGMGTVVIAIPVMYRFWFGYIDVLIRKQARQLDSDLLFISEYFLVSLESGLPLGNAIQNLSKLDRPGGHFFKKVYTEFNTGKDLEEALEDASSYCASQDLKVLLKRLKDSLSIGVDLRTVLETFIEESSQKKIVEIRSYSKKLNPIIMFYLILGVVLPSLGVTFFILGAAMLEITPNFLRLILIFIFLAMFAFQYVAYSIFKFNKASI
jgi:hypothetical protein